VADKPQDSFSEYVKNRRPYTPGFKPTFTAPGSLSGEFSDSFSQGEGTNRGWLATITDVLNSSLYPQVQQTSAILDFPETIDNARADFAQGNVGAGVQKIGSNVWDVLSNTWNPMTVGSNIGKAFAGAERPEGERDTFESVVEKAYDVSQRNNPNYVDISDNVNPIAKAGIGLTLDIFADPITWAGAGTLNLGRAATRGGASISATAKAGDEISTAATTAPNVQATSAVVAAERIPGVRNIPSAQEGLSPSIRLTTDAGEPTRFAAPPVGGTLDDWKVYGSRFSDYISKLEGTAAGITAREGIRALPVAKPVQSTLGGTDNLPASKLSEEVADAVNRAAPTGANATDEILRTVRETVNKKTVATPAGGRTNLRGGISGLFKTLSKPTAQAVEAKQLAAGPFARKLRADLANPSLATARLSEVLETFRNPNMFTVPGAANARIAPTIGKAFEQFTGAPPNSPLQLAIADKVLRPLLEKYNAAVAAGKSVNALGLPASASAAAAQAADNSTAAIIATNLKNIDGANKEKAIALFGEDFFQVMSGMAMPELTAFIDDAMVLVRKSGVIDDISLLSRTPAMSGFLKVFNIDEAMLNAARLDVDQKLLAVDGVTPETLAQNIENMSKVPGIQQNAFDNLAANGFDVARYNNQEADEIAKVLDEVFNDAIKPALLKTFSDTFRKENGYILFTDEGIPRTASQFGEGLGIKPNVVNTHTLMDLWVNIGKVTNPYMEGGKKTLAAFQGAQGKQRAALKYKFDLAVMKSVEDFLEARGIPINMDWRITKNGSEINRQIRLSQALEETLAIMTIPKINNGMGVALDWHRLLFSNAGTGVAVSKFMDGIMTAITGGNIDDVLAVITSAERRNLYRVADDVSGIETSPGKISNWLADGGEWGRYGTFTRKEAAAFKDTNLVKKGRKTRGGGTERLFRRSEAARILAEAIMLVAPKLDNLATGSGKSFTARITAESEAVTEQAAKILSDVLYDSTRYAEAIQIVDKSGRLVKDVSRSIENISPAGAALANTKVSLALGKNVKNSASTTANLSKAVASGDPKAIAKATDEYYRQIDDIIRDIDNETYRVMDDLINGRTQLNDPAAQRLFDNQLAEAIDVANDGLKGVFAGGFAAIRGAILKNIDPLDQFFNSRRGMGAENQLFISQLYRGVESLQGHLQSKYLLPINQIGQRFNGWVDDSTTIVQQALNNIRQGVRGDGVVGQAQDALDPYFARLFGGSQDPANALIGSVILRTGVQLERVNDVLSQKKILETTAEGLVRGPDEYFDLNLAKERLGPNATNKDIMDEVASQWKTWDIQDPIQFLDRMYRASIQLAGEAGYMNKFVQEGIALGIVSKTPGKGFIKVGPKSEGVLNKHLAEDVYMDPNIIDFFKSVDEMVEGTTPLGNIPFGGKLDEFTDATKYAMTQARLGHHVRNYVGGLTMNHMAMGPRHYGKAHKDAIRTLNTIRNNDEYDLMAAMTAMDIPLRSTKRNASKAAEVLYKSPKTGKSVTAEQVIDAANRLGLFPKVRSAEAFATMGQAQGLVGRFTQKFMSFASLGLAARGGRVERFWSTISEAQDHTNRLHLFLQYTYQALDGLSMQRGIGKAVKPKDLDDIFTFAAERTLKFHPTAAILTSLEKAIPRRLFPFYTWNKGALIALTEAITMAPGRVNLPTKINYNLGVATGVDPNSMYDPFPQDQQFPSWLTEDIQGPQFYINGKYYGAQPGIAQWDILNQFGASDNAFDPIRQVFVDSLNPAFKLPLELLFDTRLGTKGPITDISDYVDQSIPNVGYFANWTGYSPSSIIIDRELQMQDKVERGIKGTEDKLISFGNWLTGFGFYNASRSDVQRSAQIERQQRIAEERERNQ
jgi:hypothetical protein